MNNIMKKKIFLFLIGIYTFIYITVEGCIYTAILCFLFLSAIGLSPIYCIGNVDGEDFNHAWVRVEKYNIEQSRLNLYHSNKIDYDNPHLTFNTTNDFLNLVNPTLLKYKIIFYK